MGQLKLKKGTRVKYNDQTGLYEFPTAKGGKFKKLASRTFPCLMGVNPYESIGKTILERFKLTEKEEIDEYWGIRGDIAELLVLDFLRESYKKQGIEVELKTWDKKEVSYDNFSRNEKFGGLLDIAIASPKEHRAVVEVKSKSMKDYDKIKANKGNKEEVLQGIFLTKLSNVSKCLMVYVFFTPDQEQTIKNYIIEKNENNQSYTTRNFAEMLIMKMGLEYTSVKIQVFKHMIEAPNKLKKDMETVYKYLVDFKTTGTLPKSYFSTNEQYYLNDLAGVENGGLF